jgi:T-complex protein 1 subunit gamma
MGVARNIMLNPRLVPGGGAVEMAVSRALTGEIYVMTSIM